MLARNAPRPATYADIEALPENMVGQILYGVLHAHPRPIPRHSRATSSLGYELSGPFDRGRGGPGGWIILDEPEVHLGPHVVVPDIAGWRRERMPRLPDKAYFELAPDTVAGPVWQNLDIGRAQRAQQKPVRAGRYGQRCVRRVQRHGCSPQECRAW